MQLRNHRTYDSPNICRLLEMFHWKDSTVTKTRTESLLTDSERFSRRRNEVLVVSGVTRGRTSRMKQSIQLGVEISHAFGTRHVQRVHRGIGSHDLQAVDNASCYCSLSTLCTFNCTARPKSISPLPSFMLFAT